MVSLYMPPVDNDDLLNFSRYLCRKWNSAHLNAKKEQLDTFQIFLMSEITLPNYRVITPQKKLLWTHYCEVYPIV